MFLTFSNPFPFISISPLFFLFLFLFFFFFLHESGKSKSFFFYRVRVRERFGVFWVIKQYRIPIFLGTHFIPHVSSKKIIIIFCPFFFFLFLGISVKIRSSAIVIFVGWSSTWGKIRSKDRELVAKPQSVWEGKNLTWQRTRDSNVRVSKRHLIFKWSGHDNYG